MWREDKLLASFITAVAIAAIVLIVMAFFAMTNCHCTCQTVGFTSKGDAVTICYDWTPTPYH